MAEQIINEKKSEIESENKTKRKKSAIKKKNRELLILPEVDSTKEKIIVSILELGKQKEYFTNDDIFSKLIEKIQIDANNIKRIKSLYSYIVKVTLELEENGNLKGYKVPGTRKIHWKLVKPPA